MKKFTVVVRKDSGVLVEEAIIAESKAELSKNEVVAIIKAERVKHPSPEILQKVVEKLYKNGDCVNLITFYQMCENEKATQPDPKPVDGPENETAVSPAKTDAANRKKAA